MTSQYGSTQSDSGEVFVPYATESYGYDADGNLTSDGRWTYIWDGENRLIEMKRDTSSPTLSSRQRLVFEYDHQGRRIRKTFYTHNGSGWVEDTDTALLYDGWNLMGELNANSANAKVRTYVWGLDLSGSEQGAGGVGGLLKVTDYTSGTTHHFVGYDGNGNVAALFDGTTGAATARYEYGPFGEPLRTTGSITGSMAKKNPFRFSTKFTDNESGLVYYGYRFYSAQTGRWLSRDPIGERGGVNLYTFVANSPLNRSDRLGLDYGWPVVPPPGYPPSLPPPNLPSPPSEDFEIGSPGRTDAVKNSASVRAEVATLVHNMLASRDKSCTKGTPMERKRFNSASTTSVAFMYFTGYFLLGQVSVQLDGSGYYEVICCGNKFGKWEIGVYGSFRDKFDELIPVPGPKKGVGSLPITFVGWWVEFHSGSE